MSNTIITNYTDLNGPTSKVDNSLVVIVNKDGTISVDKETLNNLVKDQARTTGISVVRVGEDGRPDDASDYSSDDDNIPHVNLTVDSYYTDQDALDGQYECPDGLLSTLSVETRGHCLIGFQNDHCYTPLTSPSQTLPPRPSSASGYEDLETSIPCMPKSNIPSSKKITIIEQQIIPKGKTLLHINPSEARIILKGSDILRKPLPSLQNKVNKPSHIIQPENIPDIGTVEERKIAITSVSPAREESESSSESINDRDSDSDYKDQKNPKVGKNKQVIKGVKKVFNKKFGKLKPNQLSASTKILKIGKIAKPKSLIKAEIKEKILKKKVRETQEKKTKILITKKRKKAMLVNEVPHLGETLKDAVQQPEPKQQETPKVQKAVPKKERKTPAHMTALLTDMTSLFSTPDVIRRVSTDAKTPVKIVEKTMTGSQNVKRLSDPKTPDLPKISELYKPLEVPISIENRSKSDGEKQPGIKDFARTSQIKEVKISIDKIPKVMDIPQLDDASLAQILQDTSSNVIPNVDNSLPMPSNVSSMPKEILPNQSNPLASPNSLNTNVLTGPLSPSLDLLGGLQPEEEGFTEDLLMHVAQLVESSENLQEVLDKQVLGKVSEPMLVQKIPPPIQQQTSIYQQSPTVGSMKNINTQYRKDPIQIVRSDGRVITLPPIEAPATRASKRKNQITSQDPHERPRIPEPIIPTAPPQAVSPVQQTPIVTKQYSNKRLSAKNEQVNLSQPAVASNVIAESDESWNSEDDPDRLWCICKQPHNNRFMICCDRCEDWFHGKCVNITKAMGQQMEEKGVEWTCPNCLKKKAQVEKPIAKEKAMRKSSELRKVEPYDNKNLSSIELPKGTPPSTNTNCIVCKKPARASSIYCSDSCILKHAQESLGVPPTSPTPAPAVIKQFTPRSQIKSKPESRVIVFERKTGRCLAGPSAPTAENLKEWLQENPTFEVVRPGTLNTNKKMVNVTKTPNKVTSQKIQTLLKFERQPKQAILLQPQPKPPPAETKTAKASQLTQSPTAPTPPRQQMKVQMPKSQPTEVKKIPAKVTPAKITPVKSVDRASPGLKSPTIPTALRIIPKDVERKGKMSGEPIRLNVKKALQEQISLRMAETSGPKFTSEDIKTFAVETELELHDLFKDVGTKYKAKYRSLMFNLKDRKNLSLWQKICDKALSPKQLVRLSPEELASQELAQWRDKEAKHQLELIKKSELDLLACAKTYVLKTHKGEEVMETKSSAPTELDPNVAVEDLVTALNDSTASVPTDVAEASASEKSSQHKHKHKSRTKRKSPSKDQRKDKSSDRVSVSNHKGTKESSSNKSHRRRGSKERVAKESSIVADNKKSKKSDKKSKEMELSKSKERQKEKKEKSHRSSLREQSKHSASSDSLKHISRDRSKHRSRSKSIESTKHASRSRDRSRHKSRSRDHSRYRSRSLSKSTDDSKRVSRSRDRSRHRSKSKDKSRRRSKSKHRSRSKQRSRTKYKSLSRERPQHRSLSQENYRSSSSTRSQSKDADPIERPKSATQKEVHPEYDPHEPMITSAFSEEDIAKSREDIYEDSYADDSFVNPGSKEYNVEYDPAKVYDSNIKTPPETPKLRWEKKTSSGTESDQEPSSTVDSTPLAVWNGCINMVDVARFYVTAHEVSGFCSDLEEDLNTELDIVGRINPDTVWDYIQKMKKAGNKDILVLRLTAANDEERMQYIALYSYLSSRNRLGVVKVTNTMTVKDFYIVPLSSHAPVPSVLQPLDGPGFDDIRSHLLVGVIVRQRKKRPAANPIETGPAKVAKLDVSGRKRSYTPPARSGDSYTPPTSPRSKPAAGAVSSSLPLPGSFSALSSSVKDKIAASLAAADDDEPYSPGDSDTSTTQDSSTAGDATAAIATDHLKLKMEELNRQIEEQKKQIMNMSANIPDEQDNEPYSPSRPMSPSASSKPQQTSIPTLSDISLPSNLQEILATIQKKSQPTVVVEEYNPSIVPPVNPTLAKADVDMRVLPPPLPAGPYSVPPPPFFINQTDKDIVPKPPSKLSTLSEAELLSMVPDDEIVVSKKRSSRFKSSIDASEPPPPGMEDEESL